jgi:hypothetical protein
MRLGAYTACLHDRPLDDALAVLAELGLTSAEINSGGFIAARTCRSTTCWPAPTPARTTWAATSAPGSP